MIKRIVIAVVLVVLVVGGLVGFNIFRARAIEDYFANAPQDTVTVSTVVAERGSWTPTIEAIGTFKAASGVDLTVETAGVVREVKFGTDQHVDKGDLLLQLDDDAEQADLEAARTQAVLDQQALRRARELSERGVGSNVSVDTARAAASASNAQVAKFASVMDQKQLKAPFGGVIGLPRVDVGQYVTPGTVVATLQDIDRMRADFTVPEQHSSRSRPASPSGRAPPRATFPTRGASSALIPRSTPPRGWYPCAPRSPTPTGASALASSRASMWSCPRSGGRHAAADGGRHQSLWQLRLQARGQGWPGQGAGDGTEEDEARTARTEAAAGSAVAAEKGDHDALFVKQVFVKTGRRGDGTIEILGGVSEGDRVVNAGQNKLSNGTPVAIDNTIDPSGEATARASAAQ